MKFQKSGLVGAEALLKRMLKRRWLHRNYRSEGGLCTSQLHQAAILSNNPFWHMQIDQPPFNTAGLTPVSRRVTFRIGETTEPPLMAEARKKRSAHESMGDLDVSHKWSKPFTHGEFS